MGAFQATNSPKYDRSLETVLPAAENFICGPLPQVMNMIGAMQQPESLSSHNSVRTRECNFEGARVLA